MVLLLILLANVLVPIPALASTTSQESTPTISGSELSDAELVKIANRIYNNTVSAEYTQKLYDSLTAKQRDVVTQRLAQLTNVSFTALKAEIATNLATRKAYSGGLDNPRLLGPGPAYNVQMPYLGTGSNTPNVGMSSQWLDPSCDSDPNDIDYRYFANTPQSVYPASMRWYSTSGLVTWALNTAYGGSLSTYGSSVYQINVCLGYWGVNLAGGTVNVLDNLKVKYR